MKTLFSFQNKNSSNPQNKNLKFGAGLTPKMIKEIQQVDVLDISSKLARKGIPSDFQDNKIIAWCSQKTVDIFEQFNEKYKMKLALPKGIFVEDFNKLNVENPNALGTCNMQPAKLKKHSNEETPPLVIFYNSLHNWENINKIADDDYAIGLSSTPHFLNFGLHEFVHSAHEDQLLNQLDAKTLANELNLLKNEKQVAEYQRKYGLNVSKICTNALEDPFEAIACDMPKVIVDSLDKTTLMPTRNPFINTPYEKLSFWQRINLPEPTNEKEELREILRNFWNGKFD